MSRTRWNGIFQTWKFQTWNFHGSLETWKFQTWNSETWKFQTWRVRYNFFLTLNIFCNSARHLLAENKTFADVSWIFAILLLIHCVHSSFVHCSCLAQNVILLHTSCVLQGHAFSPNEVPFCSWRCSGHWKPPFWEMCTHTGCLGTNAHFDSLTTTAPFPLRQGQRWNFGFRCSHCAQEHRDILLFDS